MKRVLFLLLSGMLSAACSSDGNEPPVLVTDLVMPDAAQEFAPGDEVTVTAQGFEPGDEIMFEIRWPLSPVSVRPEGYAKGVWGVITARTATSITFLAPGHYPASATTVYLWRAGRMMPMGTISVADGQLGEHELYGIVKLDTGETAIDGIDIGGGTFCIGNLGSGKELTCPVSAPGTGWLQGVSTRGGKRTAVGFDLTMRYFEGSAIDRVVAAGIVGTANASVGFLLSDGGRIMLSQLTRSVVPVPAAWLLPRGVTSDMICGHPFAFVDSEGVLLSVCNPDSTYMPLLLPGSGSMTAVPGPSIEADALVPLHTVVESEDEPGKFYRVGAYAVSRDGRTALQVLNPATMELEDMPSPVVMAGTVRSVAQNPSYAGAPLYLLCGKSDGTCSIYVYDAPEKSLEMLPGEFRYSEIVVAK